MQAYETRDITEGGQSGLIPRGVKLMEKGLLVNENHSWDKCIMTLITIPFRLDVQHLLWPVYMYIIA